MTTGFKSLHNPNEKIKIAIDKGANILRTTYSGAQSQSVIQLEYQNCVLSLKEIHDISQYAKEQLIVKYFNELEKCSKESKQYTVDF